MYTRKLATILLLMILVVGTAADSFADISSAAVLFLRIAPGSRAAGMGEAYVAIADDATATHWNPAGLGAYPLSDSWIETKVPEYIGSLKEVAAIGEAGARSHMAYDVWAISENGLVRYDNKNWFDHEVFSTKTDETIIQKVQKYFNLNDEKLLEEVVSRVIRANSEVDYDVLVNLQHDLLNNIPENYRNSERIAGDFDSLLVYYNLCRLNWNRVLELQKQYHEGMKDSTLSDEEVDRISVALERSRNRFLPEEIVIPYSALFGNKITAIASNGQDLLVGSPNGLARFNGKIWNIISNDDNLPSNDIKSLVQVGHQVVIITNAGLSIYNGITIQPFGVMLEGALPDGIVEAVGGRDLSDMYAIINGDMYHFDGRMWSNKRSYVVAVDDTQERIAEKFSIYDTQKDIDRYLEKFNAISAGVTLDPGSTVTVPYVASVKGKVNDIHVDMNDRIWLGTSYGIFFMADNRWQTPGYKSYEVAEGQMLTDLSNAPHITNEKEANDYKSLLMDYNDLDNETLTTGQVLKVYSNPAAVSVNKIGITEGRVQFATDGGLIEYDGTSWARSDLKGLSKSKIIGVESQGENVWLASDDRLVIKAKANLDISLMHVKWLPELADDLYYEFFSVVSHVDGWGTFGGNITYISYGTFIRTGETSSDPLEQFDSYDVAVTGSFGTSITSKLKGGISAKVIYSLLSQQGTVAEQGSGTATGFAIDFGLLYQLNPRLNFGFALTNLGPKMSYIDAAQSDDLPRNLAFGVAYKVLQSEYTSLLVTAEINKLLVGLGDKASDELQQSVLNGGAEFTYANLLSVRAGYIYDQEGSIKTPTFGAGLTPIPWLGVDFAWIPSQDDFSLANTMRISLRIQP